MKTVLVTGSEGLLATQTIPYIQKQGFTVLGVDKQPKKSSLNYKYVQGDLSNQDFVSSLTAGRIDYILHMAASLYGVKGFHENAADILSRDTRMNTNLYDLAVTKGTDKFIFISSSMVYERSKSGSSKEEDFSEMRIPHTGYGMTKVFGEKLCEMYWNQYAIPYTIWRPFNILSTREIAAKEGYSHVFSDMIRKIYIEKQRPVEILGSGNQVRCFTWIDDVARMVGEKSFSGFTDNEIYNLGNPTPTKIVELAEYIWWKTYPNKEYTFTTRHKKTYDDDVRIRIPDCSKARNFLGWKPTKNLAEMIDMCIEVVDKRNDI
tara:strand:- start:468 stop:1424 length:957 start_codon:yes stop_codon:yes gene_type:complete